MPNNLSEQNKIDFFNKNGYLIISDLFSNKEINDLINKLKSVFDISNLSEEEISSSQKSYKLTDGITKNKSLWGVITNEKILKFTKLILRDEICYAQHSDLHINNRGGRFHRDSRCRVFGIGSDWNEQKDRYGIVRVAIYLTDYEKSNSSLIIFPGSHKYENWLQKFEFRLLNKFISILKKFNLQEIFPKFSLTRKMINYKTKAGDVVIFDQRIVHGSGNIGVKKNMPKYSIFLAYGLHNIHTSNHKKYYVDEKNLDYQKQIDENLLQILKEKNLNYLY